MELNEIQIKLQKQIYSRWELESYINQLNSSRETADIIDLILKNVAYFCSLHSDGEVFEYISSNI